MPTHQHPNQRYHRPRYAQRSRRLAPYQPIALLLALLGVIFTTLASNIARAEDTFSGSNNNNFNPSTFTASPINTTHFLPVEQAFRVQGWLETPNKIVLQWQIADGYYLYRDRFRFQVEAGHQVLLGIPQRPKGTLKQDEYFGETEVYYQQITLNLPVDVRQQQAFNLQVDYQGCADAGYCYPPHSTSLTFTVTERSSSTSTTTAPPISSYRSEEGRLQTILANEQLWLIVTVFFLAGLGLTFTPCVLPMIPILSSIIVGQEHINPSKRQAFSLSLSYVLGMSITYTSAGLLMAYFGAEMNIPMLLQQPWLLISFAVVFILLAISMFGAYDLTLPHWLQHKLQALVHNQTGGTYIGVALMGMLSSIIVSPCISAPLIGALAYISSTGDRLLGATALGALSLGMGTPLLVIGTTGGQFLPKAGAWMQAIRVIFGFLLLAVAIWLIERLLPSSLTLGMWAVLGLSMATYLFLVKFTQAPRWFHPTKITAVLLAVYGISLLVGSVTGASDPLRPLARLGQQQTVPAPSFQAVQNLAEIEAALAKAQQQQKPVLLDFYADWCISCKVIERTVFTHPEVANALQRFLLIRIDISSNTAEHKRLLQHYDLFGLPAMLFFSPQQQELLAFRIQGDITAERFLKHLRALQTQLATS